MSKTVMLATHVDPTYAADIDTLLRRGEPGDPLYFRSRGEFIRVATTRLMAELANDSRPNIRKRERILADS